MVHEHRVPKLEIRYAYTGPPAHVFKGYRKTYGPSAHKTFSELDLMAALASRLEPKGAAEETNASDHASGSGSTPDQTHAFDQSAFGEFTSLLLDQAPTYQAL